jgi:adenylate cyclase class 2
MLPPSRNLELKAFDPSPTRSLRTCFKLGAEDIGLLLQEDTFFEVPRGRLKLRREGSAPAQLIAYERADQREARESLYRIATVSDATETEAALAAALGIEVRVSKQRRLFLLRDIRIHLDLVVGLGNFIEFEAVADRADPADFGARLTELREAFEIADTDLIAKSYGDLKLRGFESQADPRNGPILEPPSPGGIYDGFFKEE